MKSAINFYNVRELLLELERYGSCETPHPEHKLIPPDFYDLQLGQRLKDWENFTPIKLTDKGKQFLNAIRNVHRLGALLRLAKRTRRSVTFANLLSLSEELGEGNFDAPLIFISWSGEEERGMAEALQSHLEAALLVKTFVSVRDIHSNHESWRSTLETALKNAQYGIICMTERNRTAAWLMYESGALEMNLSFKNVTVLLMKMQKELLPSPLRHKHICPFDKKHFTTMLNDISTELCLPAPRQEPDTWTTLRQKIHYHLKRIPSPGKKEGNELQPPSAPGIADAPEQRVYMQVTAPEGLLFGGNLLSNGAYFSAPKMRVTDILDCGDAKLVSPDMPMHVGIKRDFTIGSIPYAAHTVATLTLRQVLNQSGNVRILPPDHVCFATLPSPGTYGYAQYEFMPRERAEELERQGRGRINH